MGLESSAQGKTEHTKPKPKPTPKEYICPLTNKIMANPVMIPMTGIVYDRTALRLWFKQNSCDPMTGANLVAHDNANDEKAPPKRHKMILNPRKDIQKRIKLYLDLYPHKKKDQIKPEDDINCQQIFLERAKKLQQRHDKLKHQDVAITYRSYPLFQKDEANPSNIKLNELFLHQNIATITFMGPNRCGKSTLLNDLMCGGLCKTDIFNTSHDPMHSCTMGAHVSRYVPINQCLLVKHWLNQIGLTQYFLTLIENGFDTMDKIANITQQDLNSIGITHEEHQIKMITNQLRTYNVEQEGKSDVDDNKGFYLIDAEGSSHQVTQFTTKMFYALYGISNVIVWNDLRIADDAFVNLMKKIKENMKSVAESPRKPKFVYLKRDHNQCFGFGEYDNLNDYIQKDEAWKWLHDMNIFRSIHGYQIEPRPSRHAAFSPDILNPFASFLMDLTPTSQRFVENGYELHKQLRLINEIGRIDTGMEKIYKTFVLDGLLFDDDETIKCGQVLRYAEYFRWKGKVIEDEFKKADHQILQKMVNDGLIGADIRIKLIYNKNIVMRRIKDMSETDREEIYISVGSIAASIAAVGGITLVLMGAIRLLARQ